MEVASSIVVLQPGMYILRHPKGTSVPLSVARAPGASGGKVETLGTTGTHNTLLRDGGDCIVMHVSEAPASLLVSAFLDKKGDPVPSLRLDQIGLDRSPAAALAAAAPPPPAAAVLPPKAVPAATGIQISAEGITLIGHIERTGDVVAAPGERLGDPGSQLRLEGFQVMWPDRPDGVDLAYNVAVENAGALPIVKTGKFCGTRGAANRITEVTFALIGPRADQFRLEGVAHFSGGFSAPVQSASPLGGPSGLEHLTALALRAAPAATPAQQANPWHASASTKIFKAPTAA